VRDTAGITAAFAAADVQPPRASIERALPDPIVRPPTDPVAAAAAAAPGPAQAPDPAFRPLTRSELTSVFHSLFETEGSRGPLSPAVAELWGAPAARARARDAPPLPDPGSPLPEFPDETAAPDAPLDLPRTARPGTRRPFNGRI